jgi:hypothetical protein
MAELIDAFHTPSMRRNSISWSNEALAGQISLGHLNTAGRPPKAPSATR